MSASWVASSAAASFRTIRRAVAYIDRIEADARRANAS